VLDNPEPFFVVLEHYLHGAKDGGRFGFKPAQSAGNFP
jgi:hypothetical protein